MIAAIVLAAGRGTRFGAIKPLVPIAGEPTLQRVLQRLDEAGVPDRIVVLGHAAGAIRGAVDLNRCAVVVNRDYRTGMASSLAAGIRAVPAAADGGLVLHADMPYVAVSTIRAVVAAARKGAVLAAPVHRGQRGFPVYLHRSTFAELLTTLVDEVGARRYIARHTEALVRVEVDDAGAVHDVDRPSDVVLEREEHESSVRAA